MRTQFLLLNPDGTDPSQIMVLDGLEHVPAVGDTVRAVTPESIGVFRVVERNFVFSASTEDSTKVVGKIVVILSQVGSEKFETP